MTATMPQAPPGFVACRVHDGDQKLIPLGAKRQITHLVALDENGRNNGGPTVCGLTRFDTRDADYNVIRPADLPGWGMGNSGVHGAGVEQVCCPGCWEVT